MLQVKAEVRASTIHGHGLFALEKIPKGAVVWRFDPRVDRVVREPPTEPQFAWKMEGSWVIPGDAAKYINHSDRPNLVTEFDGLSPSYAARDIGIGEEITESYIYDLDWVHYADKLE